MRGKKRNIWEIKERTVARPLAEKGILTASTVSGGNFGCEITELSDLVSIGPLRTIIGPHSSLSKTRQYIDAIVSSIPAKANAYHVMGTAYNEEDHCVMAVQYFHFKERKYIFFI